jgi:hypothetical protein
MDASHFPSIDAEAASDSLVRFTGADGNVKHMRVEFSPLLLADPWAFLCGSLDFNATTSSQGSLRDTGTGAWVPYPATETTRIASVCLLTTESPHTVVFQFADHPEEGGGGAVSVLCADSGQRDGLFRTVADACATHYALGFVVFCGKCIINKYQINTGGVTREAWLRDTRVYLGAVTVTTPCGTQAESIGAILNTHSQFHASIGNVFPDDFRIFWGSGNEN